MTLGILGIPLHASCVLQQLWLFPAIEYGSCSDSVQLCQMIINVKSTIRKIDVKLSSYQKTHEVPEPNTVTLNIIFLEDTRNGIG
jgi:hypothetical protein